MTKSTAEQIVTRDYTINLHKRLLGLKGKKRAPKAIKVVKQFAQKEMNTKDVRLDSALNKHIWSQGIAGVPFRLRVRISRKRKDADESGEEGLYSVVSYVPVESFKTLQTEVVHDA